MRLAPLLAIAVAWGCEAKPTVAPTDSQPTPAATDSADGRSETPPPAACSTGDRLGSYAFVPSDAPLVAAIDVRDPDLVPALAQLTRTIEANPDLPIAASFAMRQWTWEIPALQSTLGMAQFDPDELLYVAGPSGAAWVLAARCDLVALIDRLGDTWDLTMRRTATGAIGSPDPDTAFAFDVVVGPGDRLALVRRGTASAWVERTTRPTPAAAPAIGAALGSLEQAPVRAVLRGRSLIRPEGKPAGGVAWHVRATAETVVIDDTVGVPP